MKHRRFHQPTHPASAKGRLSLRREALVYVIFGALWTIFSGFIERLKAAPWADIMRQPLSVGPLLRFLHRLLKALHNSPRFAVFVRFA